MVPNGLVYLDKGETPLTYSAFFLRATAIPKSPLPIKRSEAGSGTCEKR